MWRSLPTFLYAGSAHAGSAEKWRVVWALRLLVGIRLRPDRGGVNIGLVTPAPRNPSPYLKGVRSATAHTLDFGQALAICTAMKSVNSPSQGQIDAPALTHQCRHVVLAVSPVQLRPWVCRPCTDSRRALHTTGTGRGGKKSKPSV
jgi:hypothetical protein